MPIPQSVGRRRFAAALIAASAGGGAILLALATPGVARQRPEVSPPAELRRVGSVSCAARGCHGAVGPTNPATGDVFIKDGESTTWRFFDPHNRAYKILDEERSLRMGRNLKHLLGDKKPSESRVCLVCHATVDPEATVPGAAIDLADGLTCEACHGPAEVWQDTHVSAKSRDEWRKDPKARDAVGMVDLSDATARATECTSCHVGDRSRGMDVNHDLIAAGHPRLNFEYSAYLEAYPKHWKENQETIASMAGDWAVGQAVTARAALQLLADRAKSAADEKANPPASVAPWPELSESECFSCHHTLEKANWLPNRGEFAVKPGRLPWATWTSVMLPELEKVKPGWKVNNPDSPWVALRAEMSKKDPDARTVEKLARDTVGLIDGWLKAPKDKPLDAQQIVAITQQLAKGWPDPREGWDQLAQRTMAIAAMVRASKAQGAEQKEIAQTLEKVWKKLEFPRGLDSPKGGKPGDVPRP
jgi:hypothetical protein